MGMRLELDRHIADRYKSPSQRVRVLTEAWVPSQVFCPSCGLNIIKFENNRPVADFYCRGCEEQFELKSKQRTLADRIIDGAYRTMMSKLNNNEAPNFFLMSYEPLQLGVTNFLVIPKHFFVPQIIEKRQPLSQNARRAGWVGCNILLQNVPLAGRIFFVENKLIRPKEEIMRNWRKTVFLSEEKEIKNKGWIVDIMGCIDRLKKKEFNLKDLYAFEEGLSKKHVDNFHIKDKIRQQLQFLRDKGYLEFLGQGRYRLL